MNASRTPARAFPLLPYVLLPLPAIVLGVLGMVFAGVSPMLWGQQLAAGVLFALLAWPLRAVFRRLSPTLCAALCLLPILATLPGEAAGGARRWIDLGALNVNAAMLVLPVFSASLLRARQPFTLLLIAAVLLCLQPDLPQLCALSAAVLPLLFIRRAQRLWASGSLLALAALIVLCAFRPVSLEPVDYCEGILSLLGAVSPLLAVVGILSLAAVPAFLFIRFGITRQLPLLALALYYTVTLLCTVTGHAPVPFMGFGLSPITGYFLACAFLSRCLPPANLV